MCGGWSEEVLGVWVEGDGLEVGRGEREEDKGG